MSHPTPSAAPDQARPLAGRVAVVAGTTRGAGRGIARMLGEAGATVYCTGRSVRGRGATPGRPETLEETAELVAAAGGTSVAVRVDHTVESEVAALAERVAREQGGRLDLLVNDVWGGDALTAWGTPFWELPAEDGLEMQRRAVHTHLLTSRHLVPLMVVRGAGLIVEITDGDALAYRGHLYYDLAKLSVIRLAYGMAEELAPHGVTALAVTPGFLRSEAMLDHFGVTEAAWRDGAARDPHFIASETPGFVGRAVAALAADPRVHEKTGGVYASWTLSDEYGFTDVDGAPALGALPRRAPPRPRRPGAADGRALAHRAHRPSAGYSALSAASGLARAARCAGTSAAASAIAPSSAATPP